MYEEGWMNELKNDKEGQKGKERRRKKKENEGSDKAPKKCEYSFIY